MSLLFAATYPSGRPRSSLRSAFARTLWAPDYPLGSHRGRLRTRDRARAAYLRAAGERASRRCDRSERFDDDVLDSFVDYLRYSASPGDISEALLRMNKDIDIRHVLPVVRVPTLILHGADDEIDAARGRSLPGRSDSGCATCRAPRRGPSRARRRSCGTHRQRQGPVPDGRVGIRGLGRGRVGSHARDSAVHRHR